MIAKEHAAGSGKGDWKSLVVVSVASLSIVLLHVAVLPDDVYWWTPDSVFYMEAAGSFLQSGEFLTTPYYTMEEKAVPIQHWPPGFPIVMALVSAATGVSIESASYLVSLGCWILLGPAVFFAVSPVIRRRYALWVAVLTCMSPGVMNWGWRGLTDVPFLTIAVLSMGMLVRSIGGRNDLKYAFAAGLLAGAAYAMRNVGIALVGTVVAIYPLAFVLGALQLKELMARWFAVGVGTAMCVLPVAWLNIRTFGTPQPYSMNPSTVSLKENIRWFINATISDLTGLSAFSSFLAWTSWALLLALGPVGFLGLLATRKVVAADATSGESSWNNARKLSAAALVLYAALGAMVVIAARSEYEWGELISERHTLQYSWALLALVFVVVDLIANGKRRWIAGVAVGAGLILGHVHWAWKSYWRPSFADRPPDRRAELLRNDLLARKVADLPDDTVLISNLADVLKISTHRRIRHFYPADTENVATQLAEIKASDVWGWDFAIILCAYPGQRTFRPGDVRDFAALGFSVEPIGDENILILRKATPSE